MYVLTVLEFSVFWIPIWVLFYLRFTDYAGIGVLESVMIASAFIFEVPSGAVADLLGKKGALVLSFLLRAGGNLVMGLAGSFPMLIVAVLLITIGGAFRSGSGEALLYDSLLSSGKQSQYQKVLANISSLKMVALALASVLGGLLYTVGPSVPFIVFAGVLLVGGGLCFSLTEPPIDTEKFNLKSYLNQTQLGLRELFRSKTIAMSSAMIIILTSLTFITGQFLNDAQLVELGWSEQVLGFISGGMFLLSAALSQLTSPLSKLLGRFRANIVAATVIAVTLIIMPVAGMALATGLVLLRNGVLEIFGNTANEIINDAVRSKFRATALSAYSMLASIPYLFAASSIGYLVDLSSVFVLGTWLGMCLFGWSVLSWLVSRRMRIGRFLD